MAEQTAFNLDAEPEEIPTELTDDSNPMAPDVPKKSFSPENVGESEDVIVDDPQSNNEGEEQKGGDGEEPASEVTGNEGAGEEAKPAKRVSKHVPYDRFSNVIDERNYWKQQYEETLKKQAVSQAQPSQQPVQAQQEDDFELSSNDLKTLQEAAPDRYAKYMAAKAAKEAERQVLERLTAQQKTQAQEAQIRQYNDFYNKRLEEDFSDLQNPESEAFKSLKDKAQEIIRAYPLAQRDIGVLHMGLKLAQAESEIEVLKQRLNKIPSANQVAQNRANKKAAALAAEATTPANGLSESDPFGFSAPFEK